jgi:DeoR/GlpR family transcriptional regulator of sugar metabolism
MNQTARQQRICELLALRGECSVDELTATFGVAGMTIRRDFEMLAQQGKVIRTHGGAAMAQRISFEFSFLERVRENHAAKQAIARAAAAMIEDGQSVLLDSGTTTLALSQCLRGKKRLRVVTTSLPIASQLQFDPEIEVLLLGGYLRSGSPDLAGALTEANLETIRTDLAFIGADGIDATGAVYNQSPEVARMLAKMAASAQRVFVVADSSKLGRVALYRYGRLTDWAGLISDQGADRSLLASLRKAGVQVTKAPLK